MKYFVFLVLFTVFIVGCGKDTPAPAVSPNTELLTARSWLYNEYYSGYGTGSQKRVYKRGQRDNVVDLSGYRYSFKKDGNFELAFGTELMKGTWKFVNNETEVEISSGGSAPTLLVVSALSRDTFDWAKEDYYAKMIPQ